ncbi:MAG TPA: pentapeptide repeat-containing protein [Thermoanaerobaculia bacterium]|nr:pentapeptide repeat-containing protein [Thermoanaerobaculia bacterium]
MLVRFIRALFSAGEQSPVDDQVDPLERQELEGRVKKLEVETRLLEQQLTRRARFLETLKVVASVSGFFAAIVALVGFLQSAKAAREVRVEERFGRALQLVGDGDPSARVAGVVSLSTFVHTGESAHAREALLALTNVLAVEPTLPVRNAIVASVESIDATEFPRSELDGALISLVQLSRGLVQEGNLLRERRDNFFLPPEAGTVESRAVSVASAIAALLRKGARSPDLSRIYLAKTNLRELDLAGTRFDGAILVGSDFRGAVLERSVFDNADLEDVSFRRARLGGAWFRHALDSSSNDFHRNFIQAQIKRRVEALPAADEAINLLILGADFTCADLHGANFTGYPVLPVFPDELESGMTVLRTSFRGADLSNANFEVVRTYGIGYRESNLGELFPTMNVGNMRVATRFATRDGVVDGRAPFRPAEGFTKPLETLAFQFSGSNWQSARMAVAMRQALVAANASNGVPGRNCDE